MESWALMAAPIATDWGEYRCIHNGHDGRIVEDEDGWYSAMSRLATDHEYRTQLIAAGRDRVDREYSWENPKCRQQWYEVFAKLFGIRTPLVE